MPNQYKIDINPYISAHFPVALFYKPSGLFSKWHFLGSYENKEKAQEVFNGLCGLPIMLGEAQHG